MQRLIKILLVGIAIMALAACGSSGDTEIAAGRPCAEIQRELDAAKAEQTDQAGTPDETEAADAVTRLEEEMESCDDGSTDQATEEDDEEATNEEDASEPSNDCPGGHKVEMELNEAYQVIEGGITTDRTPEMRELIAQVAAKDPNVLFHFHNVSPLGQTDPLGDVAGLVEGRAVEDGHCYSQRAIDAYERWLVLWQVADITPVEAMPPGWSNTGVGPDGPTVGHAPTGNTEGWMVDYRDANGNPAGKHGVMKRCGNPVVQTPPPGVPSGPTDEPPPAEPPGPPGEEPPPVSEPGKDPSRDPAAQGNVPPQVQGPAPPVQRPAEEPAAGRPPATYVPPPRPTVPPTTRPGPPVTPPATTSPPATLPPTTAPPTTMIPPPRSAGYEGTGDAGVRAAGLLVLPMGGLVLAARRRLR